VPNIVRLKRRAEFKAAARGPRVTANAFVLQATCRTEPIDQPAAISEPCAGVGFTATKRLGGAVVRNRIRRRLREAVRQVFPGCAAAGVNYVLVAKPPALTCAFTQLLTDLERSVPAVSRRVRSRGA